ncbi:MAG TPA: hypothetical protein EYO68_07130 [Candidatus Lambdaproteobacteria bacterium]|nr:hypothetical protein [Candidatus Lambdaproteobacteria bacterium]
MAKPKIINSNPKRTISFSNFNRLDKGLKIAIGLKWSKLIINDVAEDKIELVEDWINNNRGKYKGINIRIGRTYTRQLVLIFSGIDELKEGLSSAIKRKFREIILEDVSEEEIKPIQNWIKKNQGKYEDINIRIGVTYKGLHPNEKEKIRNKVGADVSFFDDSTLHLEENGEKLFFDNWINSESPQKRIDRIEREIKHQQKTYKIKGIEKIEKKKIKLELKYLKQLLDQNKIEIEIFDELKKQTEKDISGNAHRRRKRWTDKKRLRLIVRVIDKKLWEENGKKPTRNDVEIELLIDSKM